MPEKYKKKKNNANDEERNFGKISKIYTLQYISKYIIHLTQNPLVKTEYCIISLFHILYN